MEKLSKWAENNEAGLFLIAGTVLGTAVLVSIVTLAYMKIMCGCP